MRRRGKRRFYAAAESAEIWDRWRRGEGLKSIGRVFGKRSSAIFNHLKPTDGGQPPLRRRSRLALTLAERHSRYVMLGRIPRRDTRTAVNALIKLANKLPDHLYQSLTWDRGREMVDHKRFTVANNTKAHFCNPHSPWQRGSNENTNRLLRQYFPKGTDLSVHSQARLNYVARELNKRPRETSGLETPKERFQACVASTG